MIDLEQLKADRKAGTAGTWKWEKNRYGYCVELAPSVIEPEEQLDLSDADARRIARLPKLEAAYIEVVAKLDMAVEALGEVREMSSPSWYTSRGRNSETLGDINKIVRDAMSGMKPPVAKSESCADIGE